LTTNTTNTTNTNKIENFENSENAENSKNSKNSENAENAENADNADNLDGYINENYVDESKNFNQDIFNKQSNGISNLIGPTPTGPGPSPGSSPTPGPSPSPSVPALVDGTTDPINPVDATFDANYVSYQKDGMQKLENKESLEQNIWRAGIGNQEVVKNYLKDGKKFYNDILTWSTDAPKTYESLNSELQYGNYNYISPLNKGMTNPEYTFVSPTNWYPIPPFPPVCVTNKRCVTSPIIMSNGKDYMNFASLEDFDAARRFTGDMQINIDYIKNVLNNPNGY
jgi:hypothetical protein